MQDAVLSPSQELTDGGLGSWHPARRPDSNAKIRFEADTDQRSTADESRLMRVKSPTLSPLSSSRLHDQSSVSQPLQAFNTGDIEQNYVGNERDNQVSGDYYTFTATITKEMKISADTTNVPTKLQRSHSESTDGLDSKARTELPPSIRTASGGQYHQPISSVVSGEEKERAKSFGASVDMSWENKDSDTAWGLISIYDTSSMPRSVDHTISFPDVPPLSKVANARSLPHSQVEDIMDEASEVTKAPESGETVHERPLHSSRHSELSKEDFDVQESFFNQIESLGEFPSSTPTDEEARFEEGLPLMPTESSKGMPKARHFQDTLNSASTLELQTSAIDEGFLKGLTANGPEKPFNPKPMPLDRKSTSQVLNSIQYPSHDESHQLLQNEEDNRAEDKITDGRIAALGSTATSQVVADHSGSREANTIRQPSEDFRAENNDLAAMWQAALADDDLVDENGLALDPSSFFVDDGEGFLEENGAEAQDTQFDQVSPPFSRPVLDSQDQVQGFGSFNARPNVLSVPSHSRYGLQQQERSQYIESERQHHGGPTTWRSSYVSSIAPPIAPSDLGLISPNITPAPIQRPSLPDKTQSFANKSKGGYSSPYDLPMDITRPKKRMYGQPPHANTYTTTSTPVPPPRSSSGIYSNQGFRPEQQYNQQPPNTALRPPTAPPTTTPSVLAFNASAPTLKAKPSTGGFFEELPVVPKPRPSSSAGRVVPSPNWSIPPPQMTLQRGQSGQHPALQQRTPNTIPSSQEHQLLPPERVLPFENSSQQAAAARPVPSANSRYSPAPLAEPNVMLDRNRYATLPAGPPRPPSISQALPFQPRHPSPLAQNASGRPQLRQAAGSEYPIALSEAHLPTENRIDNTHSYAGQRFVPETSKSFLPISNSTSIPEEPLPTNRTLSYNHPLEQSQTLSPVDAPIRSQTQSPSALMSKPVASVDSSFPYLRRASTAEPLPPSGPGASYHVSHPAPNNTNLVHARRGSQMMNYIGPTDGRELDPLERWRGCPIFAFGFGGNIVTSFPKQVPLFGVGQTIPAFKCGPGEVKVCSGKILSLDETIATFPGPLKSKSKKKDVFEWLSKVIKQFEEQHAHIHPDQTLPDPRKRLDEKILLWKVIRVLIEYDGNIEGNKTAVDAIRAMLSPELTLYDSRDPLAFDANSQLRGISRPSGAKTSIDSVHPTAIDDLRKTLLQGDREKAVWHAVDQRLWGHAMLISFTLSREIWKQVAQEFVRHEVKTFGNNTESLAALYDVFAGNWEESVDELVPPSARAGLQMVSKVAGSGPTKNALAGLDRWQETLGLILSNRTPDDGKALVALGRLLSGYGRIEAAHICYIFANSPSLFGGSDDPQVSVTLLGADHFQQPSEYSRDLHSILLTEVYEFGLSTLATSTTSRVSPYIQAYKLYHAMILAECGYRNEAQQYCETITNTLKATTKLSPYYHTLLFNCLDDLISRLRQAPKDSSTSWIPKPNIDKVSGSVWARFNQFVAGDDSGTASTGSGNRMDAETGPFARVSGEVTSISRTPSAGDLYGSYQSSEITPGQTPSSNVRYAPGGVYKQRSSFEQADRSSGESQRPYNIETLKKSSLQRQSSYSSLPAFSPDLYRKPQHDALNLASRPATASFPSRPENYLPTPPVQLGYKPEALPEDVSRSLDSSNPYGSNQPSTSASTSAYKPSSQNSVSPPLNNYMPTDNAYSALSLPATRTVSQYERSPTTNERSNTYEPISYSSELPSTSYEPPSTSFEYEPPNTNSYSPLSIDPGIQDTEDSPKQDKGRSRSFMNDEDGDTVGRTAALAKEEKARKDREADERVRQAAEADGTMLLLP